MDDPAAPLPLIFLGIFKSFSIETAIGLLIMLFLLLCSALISGSEIAFYSLSPQQKDDLKNAESKKLALVLALLDHPKRLLATILIANNFVNVGIVILSDYLVASMFDVGANENKALIIQLLGVTGLLLLLGEILPKIYANRNQIKLASLMAQPLHFLNRLFAPLSKALIWFTSLYRKQGSKGDNISVDELSHALELAGDDVQNHEEKKILEGIVKFGNTDVKQIMTPRMDVVAVESGTNFDELINCIRGAGYSRLLVFDDNMDSVNGVIYIKDLLPFLDEKKDYAWQDLIRKPYFVPENKKIDDLLKEFQEMKIHLAVVVDEYGGSSGIITLEDIIEEIVGDISDEFDDDELVYSKLDDSNYIFEGKTSLIDLYRVLDIDGARLEAVKGEADTLAGFVLEQTGKIPKKGEKIQFENLHFTIEAADKRRVKRIKVTLNN